jgi:MSHA biogenesis protein MshK
MRRRCIDLILFLAGAVLSTAGGAQALTDPTRPPSGFNLAEAGAKVAESAPAALVLESVLIHPHARSAIISGERVALGQKIRGVRVVRIADTEVVLLDGGARRTLKLYPSVQKKPSPSADPPPSGG